MWLFGIWLAEGSYMKAHKKINGIRFSLNINRKDLVKKINSILKIYGKTTTNVRENKNITEIYLCNKNLSILFHELFNENSKNKRIHKDLFQTNAKKLLELFKGFYEGDGDLGGVGTGVGPSTRECSSIIRRPSWRRRAPSTARAPPRRRSPCAWPTSPASPCRA